MNVHEKRKTLMLLSARVRWLHAFKTLPLISMIRNVHGSNNMFVLDKPSNHFNHPYFRNVSSVGHCFVFFFFVVTHHNEIETCSKPPSEITHMKIDERPFIFIEKKRTHLIHKWNHICCHNQIMSFENSKSACAHKKCIFNLIVLQLSLFNLSAMI